MERANAILPRCKQATSRGFATVKRKSAHERPDVARVQPTGHASAEMNAQYTHHELESLRAAVPVIPSIGSK